MAYVVRCPDGHGVLYGGIAKDGRLYCPHAAHGGNGRFFQPSEAVSGYAPIGGGGRPATVDPSYRPPAATAPRAERSPASPKARPVGGPANGPECLCGCGERTKGGRFRPGHDARYHAAQKKAGLHP